MSRAQKICFTMSAIFMYIYLGSESMGALIVSNMWLIALINNSKK